MWIFALFLGVVALFLFSRLRRFNVSAPIALIASLAVVLLPFVLIPLIGIWLLVRFFSGKSLISVRVGGIGNRVPPESSKMETVDVQNRFCSKCGEDVPSAAALCPACGNAISV